MSAGIRQRKTGLLRPRLFELGCRLIDIHQHGDWPQKVRNLDEDGRAHAIRRSCTPFGSAQHLILALV